MSAPYAGFDLTMTAGGKTVGKAQNVDIDMSSDEVDVTVRDSNGWKEFIQGLKEWTASVDQLWIPTDEALILLEAAFFSGDIIACTFMDPDGYGFTGNCIVVGIRKGEPLDGATVLPISLRGTGPCTPDVTPGS